MSSYSSPAAQGDPKATGLYAVTIAAQAGGTNNDAHLTDSAGNTVVDFVWGATNPIQPNDIRIPSPSANATGGTRGSSQVSYNTAVVTAASADGTTVTYTANNSFNAGQIVTITGLSTSAFNLTNVTIATVSSTQFTVTNSATGTGVTGATAVAKVAVNTLPGVGADYGWGTTTDISSGYLAYGSITVNLNNGITKTVGSGLHTLDETTWGAFPSYAPALGNFILTGASGNGTTVTYTGTNFLNPGDTVNITGFTTSAFNLSNATVATSNRQGFTVTNSAGSGVTLTGQYAKAEYTTALTGSDGAYIAGVDYVDVPSVLGFTTALAVDALNDAELVQTTASAATNTATQPTRINVTATTAATVYVSGGTGTWPVGTKVTIASGTGIPTALVGTWSVTGGDSSTLVIAGSGWTVADTGSITPGTKLTGASGTIKSQSVAAGAASIAAGTAVTITPWA